MLVWIGLVLIALAWASWLFGRVFTGSKRLWAYLSMLLLAVVSAAGIYHYQGAYDELKKTAQLHEKLQGYSLEELVEKANQKDITIEDLLAELRLRAESQPNDFSQWRQMGNIFLKVGQVSYAEQAFNRAVATKPGADTRLEFARYYIEQGSDEAFTYAERHLNLVLLKQPRHEGALLLQGINLFKQQKYEGAISYWQSLLELRDKGSDSYQLISQQIEMAQRQLKLSALNHISVVIDNLDSLLLTRYKKAFVLVRSQQGGPPVAVRSYDMNELNKALKLTPKNVMLPDVDLWQSENVYVEVRLSQSGLAQPESGDRFGKTPLIQSLTPSETFHVEITETVE